MNEKLCDTALTGSKIFDLLSKSPHAQIQNHQLQSVEATPVGDGEGFMSKVIRIHLQWRGGDTHPAPPKSIIVKVIGNQASDEIFGSIIPDEAAKMSMEIRQIHNVECNVYDLEELPSLMKFPICYFKIRNTDEDPGIIALEDLGDRGSPFSTKQAGLGMNKAQLDEVLEALSTLHAWSVNTSVNWRQKLPSYKDCASMETWVNQLPIVYRKSKETYPHVFENVNEEKLLPYLNFDAFAKVFDCDPKSRYDLPSVIVHGDIHFSNMVWEKSKDDDAPGDRLVALIDWQMAHIGCGVEDLARLLCFSISLETRRHFKDYALKRYVEVNGTVLRPAQALNSLFFVALQQEA